jgi:hypothetical protein
VLLLWPQVICTVGNVKPQRNQVSTSTLGKSRVDSALAANDCPPFVLVGEKATDAQLQEAVGDITRKFVFTPHYEKVDFVIGIAIAGAAIKFFKHKKSQSGKLQCVTYTLSNHVSRLRWVVVHH